MSSVLVFFADDKNDDLAVDEVAESVVVVVDVVVVFGSVLVLVASSFTVGVAPGIDDNKISVDAEFGDEETTGDKDTSGSLGKLSVYNTLAWLLHRTNRCH